MKGGLTCVYPEMQWAMANEPLLDDPINRDLLWSNAMQEELPKNWKGLLRLGSINRLFFTTETNKHFVMEMVFRVFKKKLKYKAKVQFWAAFTIHHKLLVRSLEALKLGPAVLTIASFLLSRGHLNFFQKYIHLKPSHEVIVSVLTMRVGIIVL